ncbi:MULTISPECIES: SMI1/KNR4 family protein [Streptomyces]|uniref:SMI1/KNR4 family protein n=1 Tax=Streptomyces TaxID=1883 RepID=UPI0004C8E2A2|nr:MULTISPECIES: SMI1/KNR4 family protein [Streptomyces]
MNSALTRLTQLLPPPATAQPKDWESIEAELGVGLPADYKELIDTYGGVYIDDYLYVLEPKCANRNYDLIDAASERAEAYEELWEFEEKPSELEEEGSSITPWATTDNGEWLFWRASPDVDPDSWTVMVNEARGEEWEHYGMTCTEFLVAALSGDVRSDILWSRFPQPAHYFSTLGPVD